MLKLQDGKEIYTKITQDVNENSIYRLLNGTAIKSNGIVDIIRIGDTSIDLELLDINLSKYSRNEIKQQMLIVKDYLQHIGIMYIDWKFDNIGISRIDGLLKLFDFDVSGIIDLQTNEWIIPPPNLWAYKNAEKANMKTPKDIDDYAFYNNFK